MALYLHYVHYSLLCLTIGRQSMNIAHVSLDLVKGQWTCTYLLPSQGIAYFLVATLKMFVHAHYYKHYAVHNYLKHHLHMSMQKKWTLSKFESRTQVVCNFKLSYVYAVMVNHGNAALQPACSIFLRESTKPCMSVWLAILMFSSLKNTVGSVWL